MFSNNLSTNKMTFFESKTVGKYYINVLLLRYPDTFSKFFGILTRAKYTHASIGVSNSDGTFYSYTGKGFRKEFPKQHPTFKRQEVPCKLYRIEVTKEIYDTACLTLSDHEKQAHNFRYNFLGILLCLLRIVWPIRKRYFCSQFVSELLEQMKAITLEKHSSLYLPDDFTTTSGLDLCFSGYLSQLVSVS